VGKRLAKRARKPSLSSRHLRWESFEQRINRGPPSVEAVSGLPRVHLFIEPAGRRIGARFFTRIVAKIPSPLAEVMIREVGIGPETALEVSTANQSLYRDFYALCCTIADRVQVEKQPVSAAIMTTLAAWGALVREKSLLSEERQIGLLGELLFLERVATVLGWKRAAAAWCGPDSEEHDFVLPSVDVEVKCTRSEQRIHRIASLTQLQPKVKRKLQFVSVQLTLGGDIKDAFSLPMKIASVLASAGYVSPSTAELVRDQIRRQGWEDEDAPNYMTRYLPRAPMMTARVAGSFPAMTPRALVSIGKGAAARIDRVSYWINVNGLGVMDGTAYFNRALFGNFDSA
jgi:Putative  PD-(D/E)XK family member, (DUF4420)